MAKASVSSNPAVITQRNLNPEQQLLVRLEEDHTQRVKGIYASKQTAITINPYNALLSVATKDAGGAVYPVSPDQYSSGKLPLIDPAVRKINNITALQYFYDISYYIVPPLGTTYTPTNFTAPIYLTIAILNYNWFYYNNRKSIAGTPIPAGVSQFTLLNTFQIGILEYHTQYGFLVTGLNGEQTLKGQVDWTEPIQFRPYTSGVRDFTVSSKSITQQEKDSILQGSELPISVAVVIDNTNLSVTNNNFLAIDASPHFYFDGSIVFEYFGVATPYTPIV